ncbi:threonine/serine exporter family protein [Atopococcus tabaci]|uniref:threonine/serine exporter family protein n=1 Tax=Atopococcus tabaci TaxID=269774 RepID=UPI00040F9C3F|nr:threonine/serine exporter family protein [Atopococcus tabaci]
MLLNFFVSIAAGVVAAGFSVLYNAPSRTTFASGLAGMAGWLVYASLPSDNGLDLFIAAGAASFALSALSQIFARRYKVPVIVFSIPALIPLVPGGTAYNTMRALMEENFDNTIRLGTETFFISGAIALGVSLSSAVCQVIHPRLSKKRLRPPMRGKKM